MLILQIPSELTTFDERLSYAECVREKLRREHNAMGAKFRDGKLSQAEWDQYRNEVFAPRNYATTDAILSVRNEVKSDARELPDDSPAMTRISISDVFCESEA